MDGSRFVELVTQLRDEGRLHSGWQICEGTFTDGVIHSDVGVIMHTSNYHPGRYLAYHQNEDAQYLNELQLIMLLSGPPIDALKMLEDKTNRVSLA